MRAVRPKTRASSRENIVTIDTDSAPRILFYGENFLLEDLPIGTRVIYPKRPLTGVANAKAAVRYALNHPEEMDPLQVPGARQNLEEFRNRLESAAVPYEETRIEPYLVYTGPGGKRLLPPSLGDPVPLSDPRAEIVAESAPAAASPGEELRIPVRITNRSNGLWSAAGIAMAAGSHRVSASYRWFGADGRVVVEYGERSLLPGDVRPGETVRMVVRARAPETPGAYDLALTLVQENVAWFDQATGTTYRCRVEVRPVGS